MCRPRPSESQRSIAAPSRRTTPRRGRPDTDQRFRERRFACGAGAEQRQSHSPPRRPKDTCEMTVFCVPGHDHAEVSRPSGCGRAAAGRRPAPRAAAVTSRTARRRLIPSRAATSCFQFASATSTGARARPIMIEDAIMIPPGRLLHHHQISTDPEHRRLQDEAQHLGCGAEISRGRQRRRVL